MPTLNWIGKEAVVNHDKEVPFRLLKKVKAHSVGDSQNLIIKGDNLEGLKALMPYYIGKVKCIYIDPPYNTGNENWVYNDKVNSPKIKKWLGKVVGGEAQDLCRHDKWLCMMYPRLKLLRDLLSDDGVIFVSIDDNEQGHLKLLMDEVFGSENIIGNFVWRKKAGAGADSKLMFRQNEHIVFYAKNINLLTNLYEPLNEKQLKEYKNPDNDERGLWAPTDLTAPSSDLDNSRLYEIVSPTGKKWLKRWSYTKKNLEELRKQNLVWFGKDGNSMPKRKRFLSKKKGLVPRSWIDWILTSEGKKDIEFLFGKEKRIFDYPKPTKLISHFVRISTDKNSIILDSFAGSGTTGHAVLDLNKEDGGNRKFILIEMEDDIAKKITAERIKRAIEKYGYKDGFEYCELDKPLFDENGQIEETCDFNQFATYIYFTETQTNIDKKQIDKNFIGESGETDYYLIYKEKYKNVLDKKFLSKIKETNNKKVIYADFCMVDDDILEKFNIQFKQIPYEVKVY